MAYSYEAELKNMKTAQKNAAMADLQATRDKTLSDLQAEQTKNAATYNTQRSTANVQNRLSAKNFQEYLANTGRANSGISAQAKLQNQNNLNTSLNNINSAESASNVDIERRRTDAGNAYNSGLASANANIEANYISNLLAQRQKAAELALQERQFNESVRQFNEQIALQRQQMYSNFRSGRGGGRYGSSGGSGGYSDTFTTAYYSGKLNKDAANGTFKNGYQPNNVNGKKLTKTGKTKTVKATTLQGTKTKVKQNIWQTSDGTKYIWNGTKNKYTKLK